MDLQETRYTTTINWRKSNLCVLVILCISSWCSSRSKRAMAIDTWDSNILMTCIFSIPIVYPVNIYLQQNAFLSSTHIRQNIYRFFFRVFHMSGTLCFLFFVKYSFINGGNAILTCHMHLRRISYTFVGWCKTCHCVSYLAANLLPKKKWSNVVTGWVD